jgi:regulator of nucleoside diphosphate kinase
MKQRTIIINESDFNGLKDLIETARRSSGAGLSYLLALEGELNRARVVPDAEVPKDVITMNSTVHLYDLDSRETETYTLVFPEDADISQGRISVFAPVGTAVIGYRVGDVIEWMVPSGMRRLKVRSVHQPELAMA